MRMLLGNVASGLVDTDRLCACLRYLHTVGLAKCRSGRSTCLPHQACTCNSTMFVNVCVEVCQYNLDGTAANLYASDGMLHLPCSYSVILCLRQSSQLVFRFAAGVATTLVTTESVAAALAAAVAACWSGGRLAEAAGMPDASLAAMALVASLMASCGGAASKRWAGPGQQAAPFAGKPVCAVLCCACQECLLAKPDW